MKSKKLYKFLREGMKSNSGNCGVWTMGEWKKEENISLCNRGFHASQTSLQALGYVAGEILSVVEVKGKSIKEEDKEVWSEMRVVKAYRWEKKDSVALSIFSAELCLENFEKLYPDDKRPREAIEAAKAVLLNDTEETRSAAESAAESAAWSARSAAESAAAWSAESAAWSARSAAESAAARSAESAARSARSAAEAEAARSAAEAAEAAEAAARSAKKKLIGKIDTWFLDRIKTLTKIK